MGEQSLQRSHFFEREAVAIVRHKIPVQPFVIRHLINSLGALLGGQCREEILRGFRHFLSRCMGVNSADEYAIDQKNGDQGSAANGMHSQQLPAQSGKAISKYWGVPEAVARM